MKNLFLKLFPKRTKENVEMREKEVEVAKAIEDLNKARVQAVSDSGDSVAVYKGIYFQLDSLANKAHITLADIDAVVRKVSK